MAYPLSLAARRVLVLATVAATCAPSSHATAQDPRARTTAGGIRPRVAAAPEVAAKERPDGRSVWEQRPLVIETQLGLGAPYGLIGLGIDASVLPWLALSAGAGTNAAGLQLAAQGRLQLAPGGGSFAIGVDAGVSRGPYDSVGLCLEKCDDPSWDPAWWANFALSFVGRASTGFNARGFVGAGVLLNPGDAECFDCEEREGAWIFMLGVALGYALKL